ncbi:MAG: tetratricopeptide repeat protein, partial [Verrucomicrobia bacterium]|nr:tetratricopeptide repeat protein [Verrucomicrobiota bacterium]
GQVLAAQGDLAGALQNYRQALAIREKLARQDPANAGWQRDLSVSYNKVGDVLRDQGDLAGALQNCRQALAIAEKLARQGPSNAQWQGDLAFASWRVGTLWGQVEPASKPEARAMVQKARDVLLALKQGRGLTRLQQGWLDAIERQLNAQ